VPWTLGSVPFRAGVRRCQGSPRAGAGTAAKGSRRMRVAGVRLFGAWRPAKCSRHPLRTESTMLELLRFISYLLTLYIYILIASAVMSWLIVFNVVNPSNQFVHMVGEFLYRVTEPVLRPIRNMLPNLGGIDISPIVVILIIIFIQEVILPNLARAFGY
jgi:YggT family protein